MNKAELLMDNVYAFFEKAAQEQGFDDEVGYAESLLNGIDFVELYHAVRNTAQLIFRYSFDVEYAPEEEYLGERLFDGKASKIVAESYSDTMCGKDFIMSRTMELWIRDDMTLVTIASHVVEYGDYECVSVYRDLAEKNIYEVVEIDLEDLAYRLRKLAEFYC